MTDHWTDIASPAKRYSMRFRLWWATYQGDLELIPPEAEFLYNLQWIFDVYEIETGTAPPLTLVASAIAKGQV